MARLVDGGGFLEALLPERPEEVKGVQSKLGGKLYLKGGNNTEQRAIG